MAVPLAVVGLGTIVYLVLAWRLRRTRHPWSGWRIASWLGGSALLAWGLLPGWLPLMNGDFRKHMLAHLLIGMIAPIGLVMAAPVTLLLRTVPARWGRRVSGILRSRVLRLVANPITALVLNLGGMAALYFTSLYTAMMTHPALHYLVHFHFLAAGCLYSWVIAGPDPAPHRPSVPARLVVLGVAIVIHSVLAQLLYARVGVTIPALTGQIQRGAELMYYGGDLSEMLLAVALVTTWRPGRPPTSDRRQPPPLPAAALA